LVINQEVKAFEWKSKGTLAYIVPTMKSVCFALKILAIAILLAAALLAQDSPKPSLPDAPTKKNSMRNFWIAAGIDTVATFSDAYATNAAQDRGCIEATPFFGGEHPSPARVYGTMFGIMAAEQTVSYLLRRHNHHKLWLAPMFANAGTHLEGAIHSATCR
jgi:hypothetical protein